MTSNLRTITPGRLRPATAKSILAASMLALVGGTFAVGGGIATAAPTPAPRAADSSASADATLTAQVQAYRSVYPSLSAADARDAALGQIARKAVVSEALADTATFGGAWFDVPTGILHVAATTNAAAAEIAADAQRQDVRVETHVVERSFAELESIMTDLRAENSSLGKAADQQVGVSVETNEVVVAVPAASVAALTRLAPAGVRVAADPMIADYEDAGCTSRWACDWTIRAGTTLWRGSVGSVVCSVGFTARNSYSRYTYTAGHCSNGNGVKWGTGSLEIGPMHASVNTGAYDAAIIRVTNSWFTGDLGGQIYMEDTDHSVDVDYEAPTLSYMVPGETVCLSANINEPNGPNYCGVFGTAADPFKRGLARVNGLDGCHGDSGGGWYWLGSSTYRVAYGLHSRSSYDGCHVSGGKSWFSALPVIKAGWVPSLNVETR